MKTEIKDIKGYQLIDSRGNPTVAARVTLECGAEGFAISPSGLSISLKFHTKVYEHINKKFSKIEWRINFT